MSVAESSRLMLAFGDDGQCRRVHYSVPEFGEIEHEFARALCRPGELCLFIDEASPWYFVDGQSYSLLIEDDGVKLTIVNGRKFTTVAESDSFDGLRRVLLQSGVAFGSDAVYFVDLSSRRLACVESFRGSYKFEEF